VDDDWLAANDLLPPTPPATQPPSPSLSPSKPKDPFTGATIRTLRLKPITTIPSTSPLASAIETMREKGFDQLPVLSPSQKLVGLITLGNCLSWISQGRASADSLVEDVMFSFQKIAEVTVDARDLERALTDKSAKDDPREAGASRHRPKRFVEITLDTPLRALSRFFERNSAAVVTERDGAGGMQPVAVVTKVDLLTWFMRQGKAKD
jgi:cystathionine beta-synthase